MRTERTGRPSRCAPSGGRPDKQREVSASRCAARPVPLRPASPCAPRARDAPGQRPTPQFAPAAAAPRRATAPAAAARFAAGGDRPPGCRLKEYVLPQYFKVPYQAKYPAPSVQCEPTVRVASPGRRPGEHRSPYGQREPLWRAIAEAAAGLFPSPEQTPR
ncbi:Protein of unknown function [Gryllus bimaculatus]|nr:Protein of unknown function [Gryllus bimaculatus]